MSGKLKITILITLTVIVCTMACLASYAAYENKPKERATRQQSTQARKETAKPSNDETIREQARIIEKSFSGSLSYKASVNLSSLSGTKYLADIVVAGSNITDFGSNIIEAMDLWTEKYMDSISEMRVSIGDPDSAIIFTSGSDNYGMLLDYRSGEGKVKNIETKEAMFSIFPTSQQYVVKQSLNSEDVAMFEEVMKILNSDMNTPEDEIYERIAPNYGMSADELKAFMQKMLIEIYK